jgi:hypothetical protein
MVTRVAFFFFMLICLVVRNYNFSTGSWHSGSVLKISVYCALVGLEFTDKQVVVACIIRSCVSNSIL